MIEKARKSLEAADELQEETVNYTKDGKKIIVVSRWTQVRNEQGQPDYMLLINSDTDLKQTEEQLYRAQRLESIGTLAGGIARDLNNVLSPIVDGGRNAANGRSDRKSGRAVALDHRREHKARCGSRSNRF